MGLFTLLATRFYALLGGVILLNFQLLIVFSETTFTFAATVSVASKHLKGQVDA